MRTQFMNLPEITIEKWPGQMMPEDEIKAVLAYLAHKTGKRVRFREHPGELKFKKDLIFVEVRTSHYHRSPKPLRSIRCYGETYELGRRQLLYESSHTDGKEISDEEGNIVAWVFHNVLVIDVEITAEYNEASRICLPYILEKAIPLIDFEVDEFLEERCKERLASFRASFLKGIEEHLQQKEYDLKTAHRDSDAAYETIIRSERLKTEIEAEIKGLKEAVSNPPEELISRQIEALTELEDSGLYEEIDLQEDGSLHAITTPVEIEYYNYLFPLGRYEIEISPQGKVKILALEKHQSASHPHPHVNTDGVPCLGNIAADIARLIGRFQYAEALQVLSEFLSSYNPEGPYEKIGAFDPTGEFVDPDEDPCENCDDCCTPYCIATCEQNDDRFGCSDCNEQRSEYCYTECSLNEGFSIYSPCDDCEDEGGEKCYLSCPYNRKWELHSPCENCQYQTCTKECPYFSRKEELNHVRTR